MEKSFSMKQHRFKYYSKNNKIKKIFTLIFTLISILIVATLYMQNSIHEQNIKSNQEQYGGWQAVVFNANAKTINRLKKYDLLDRYMIMSVQGNVYYDDLNVGKIGSVDSRFKNYSNIKLKKGRYPTKDNEICIEAYSLDQMGISYDLGQFLSLKIVNNDFFFEKKFKLVGVIENYSKNWIGSENLISFFTQLSPSETESRNIFISVKPGYESSLDEIKIDDNVLIKNLTYNNTYDFFSKDNIIYTFIGTLLIIFSILFLVTYFYNWQKIRIKEIQVLKAIGASDKDLMVDFLILLLKCMFFPWLVSLFVSFLLKIPPIMIIEICAFYLIALSSIYIFNSLLILNIPTILNSYSNQSVFILRKPRKINHKQTFFTLLMRSNQIHLYSCIFRLLLQILILVSIYICISVFAYNTYLKENLDNSPDFLISSKDELVQQVQYFENNLLLFDSLYSQPPINPNVIKQITNIMKTSDYTLCYMDHSNYITWNGDEQSSVWNTKKDNIYLYFINKDKNEVNRIFPYIYSYSSPDICDFIKNNLDEGSFNKEKFMTGEEIYIYLPDYTIRGENNYGYSLIDDSHLFIEQDVIFTENTINIGDSIKLTNVDGKSVDKKIGGIIRNFSYSDDVINTNEFKPYTIFAPDSIFVEKGDSKLVNNMSIRLNEMEDVKSIENILSSIASKNNLSFSNFSQEKRNKDKAYSNAVLISSSLIVCLFLIEIFLMNYNVNIMEKKYLEKERILFKLGVETTKLKKYLLFELLFNLLLGYFISVFIYLGLIYIYYINNRDFVFSFINHLNTNYWSWNCYFLLMLLSIIFNMVIYFLQNRKRVTLT